MRPPQNRPYQTRRDGGDTTSIGSRCTTPCVKRGIEVTVFNGAHARNLPGRKSDVSDCQWHAMLHSHGLLRPCFIADDDILQLRTLYRLRDVHLSMASAHIHYMQRALDLFERAASHRD